MVHRRNGKLCSWSGEYGRSLVTPQVFEHALPQIDCRWACIAALVAFVGLIFLASSAHDRAYGGSRVTPQVSTQAGQHWHCGLNVHECHMYTLCSDMCYTYSQHTGAGSGASSAPHMTPCRYMPPSPLSARLRIWHSFCSILEHVSRFCSIGACIKIL